MDEPGNPLDPDPERRLAILATFRERCPVVPLAHDRSRLLAVSHKAVATGLAHVEDFGGSAAQDGLPEDETTISGILEPRHGHIRRIINSVVAFHKSQQIEPFLAGFAAQRVGAFVDAALASGPEGVDVMPYLGDPFPPAAMARLLGFPEADSERYYGFADVLGHRIGEAAARGESMSLAQANPEFAEYVDRQIAAREAMPREEWPNDALTRFMTTEVDGERLSRRSIVIQIMFMIGAGSETTRNLIGNALYRLALDHALQDRVRSDRSLVDRVVEEALRIDAPAQFLVRRCLHATELDGEPVEPGQQVFVSIASANRDKAVFDTPDEFDVDRDNLRDHLGFGTGSHICPGAQLARLEVRLLLNAVFDRVPRFSLGAGYTFDHIDTGMLHGPKSLRLRVEA